MNSHLNTRRILIYLAFAFGLPWSVALLIALSSWYRSAPLQAQGVANIAFISTPWLASIAARLVTREGWVNLGLRPNFRRGWRFYLAAWLLPLAAVILGALLFYLLLPQSFDPNLGAVQTLVAGTAAAGMNPWLILLSAAVNIALIAALINTFVSMGEELGWRGYLLPKLVERLGGESGARKAALLTGLIHGVWHWPLMLMLMGVQPGVTPLTPLVYLIFTCSLSVLLSWVTLRSGSVWPAALGHGATNAASALPGFLLKGAPVALLGPDPSGLIGGIGFTMIALALLLRPQPFAPRQTLPAAESAIKTPAL